MPRLAKDGLNPEHTDRDVRRIVELIVEVRQLWEQAVDGGVYSPKTETNGRGRGFDDSDPTYSTVTRPTQRQLRSTARYAADLIAGSRDRLEDAARVLHNGLLRTDPEVLAEHLEKRRAATQGR
jgi:hypothetical protein